MSEGAPPAPRLADPPRGAGPGGKGLSVPPLPPLLPAGGRRPQHATHGDTSFLISAGRRSTPPPNRCATHIHPYDINFLSGVAGHPHLALAGSLGPQRSSPTRAVGAVSAASSTAGESILVTCAQPARWRVRGGWGGTPRVVACVDAAAVGWLGPQPQINQQSAPHPRIFGRGGGSGGHLFSWREAWQRGREGHFKKVVAWLRLAPLTHKEACQIGTRWRNAEPQRHVVGPPRSRRPCHGGAVAAGGREEKTRVARGMASGASPRGNYFANQANTRLLRQQPHVRDMFHARSCRTRYDREGGGRCGGAKRVTCAGCMSRAGAKRAQSGGRLMRGACPKAAITGEAGGM